jgi:hypothetical protein
MSSFTDVEHSSQAFWPLVGSPRSSNFARLSAFCAFTDALCFALSLSSSPSSPFAAAFTAAFALCFSLFRFALHDLLHVVTSSQQFSHFFLHVNGRAHTTHVLLGRFSFFTPRIVDRPLALPPLATTARAPAELEALVPHALDVDAPTPLVHARRPPPSAAAAVHAPVLVARPSTATTARMRRRTSTNVDAPTHASTIHPSIHPSGRRLISQRLSDVTVRRARAPTTKTSPPPPLERAMSIASDVGARRRARARPRDDDVAPDRRAEARASGARSSERRRRPSSDDEDEEEEEEEEDEEADSREGWMSDSAKDLWMRRASGPEAAAKETRRNEAAAARPSVSASPRGILTPTGSLRNNGKRTVRFETSLPHGFPERKPSLVKACWSRGAGLDFDSRLGGGVDEDDESTPWVGFLLVILTVTFVACCGELSKRLYSLVAAPVSPFLFV